MFKNMLKNVNIKSLCITVVAVFVFIFMTDFLIHGCILKGAYHESASLWRPESEGHSYMIWLILAQLINAKYLSILFAKGYEGKGVIEGIRFGILVAPLMVATSFVWYAVTPLPMSLMWAWVILGYIQGVGASVVAALVYRK